MAANTGDQRPLIITSRLGVGVRVRVLRVGWEDIKVVDPYDSVLSFCNDARNTAAFCTDLSTQSHCVCDARTC